MFRKQDNDSEILSLARHCHLCDFLSHSPPEDIGNTDFCGRFSCQEEYLVPVEGMSIGKLAARDVAEGMLELRLQNNAFHCLHYYVLSPVTLICLVESPVTEQILFTHETLFP